MAEIDLGNVMGPQGEDGSQWYWGTAITGTSTSGAVFSSSGIANARVNDKYYNTSTSNIYTCTTAGAASVARWAYIGNIKGEQGNIGPAGPTGSVDFTTPITFSVAGTRADLASGDSIATLFGKTQKWFADINSGGASTLLATNLSANRALVSNASGKVAVSSVTSTELGYLDGVTSAIQTQFSKVNNNIGTLSSLETSAKSSIVAAVNELNGKIGIDTLYQNTINELLPSIGTIASINCNWEPYSFLIFSVGLYSNSEVIGACSSYWMQNTIQSRRIRMHDYTGGFDINIFTGGSGKLNIYLEGDSVPSQKINLIVYGIK